MKLRLFRERLAASTSVCCATLVLAGSASTAFSAPPQSVPATRTPTAAAPNTPTSGQVTQPSTTPSTPNQGIVYATATPDSVLTVKTGAGVVTRVSLPEEAKSAICGDLYDPTTNAGSFIINREGNDVYIKPVPKANARSNLFVRTDKNVFNFDLVIVPPEQAHRVFNVNIPTFEKDIEAVKEQARRDLEAAYQARTNELEATVKARLDELDRTNDAKLDEERAKIRAEAEGKANEKLMTRVVDGMLHGFGPVVLADRSGKLGPVSVTLDSEAQTFEGMLYVKYRITNNTAEDVVYLPPRVTLRALTEDRNAPIVASTFTDGGELRVPAKSTSQGVIVFERPTLQKGDKVLLIFRGEDVEKMTLQLSILTAV